MSQGTPLRIVTLTGVGSWFVDPLLRSGHSVVGVIEVSDSSQQEGRLKKALRAAYHFLRNIKPSPTTRQLTEQHNIPYYSLAQADSESLAEWLKNIQPDVLAVYKGPILEEAILQVPRFGAINIHPSHLPRYRGGHPILWMAYFTDLIGGATVHFLDKNIDTGDIIYQSLFPIELGTSENEVEKVAVEKHGIPLLLRALNAIAEGNCPRVPQPAQSPTPWAKRVQGEEYWNMIDWQHWPIERTWHFLRCTPIWLSRLPARRLCGRFFCYQIGNYEKKATSGEAGSLGRDARGRFFVHPEGKIRIEKRFSFKLCVKTLLCREK